jgi:hypothetical protein
MGDQYFILNEKNICLHRTKTVVLSIPKWECLLVIVVGMQMVGPVLNQLGLGKDGAAHPKERK